MSVVILSGAYCDQEFWPEIGRVPPSFLPLGNKRLFEYQLELLGHLNCDKYITLPHDYDLNDFDKDLLTKAGFMIIRTDALATISDALLQVIGVVKDRDLTVLFGDTLVHQLPKGIDYCAMSIARTDYNWGKINLSQIAKKSSLTAKASRNTEANIHCGVYNFSNLSTLKMILTYQPNDFTDCILRYDKEIGINFPFIENWLDFGHLKTYFNARMTKTTERSFNKLIIDQNKVIKRSNNVLKLNFEKQWYKDFPDSLKLHIPRYLGDANSPAQSGYAIEYLHLFPLSELYLHGNLTIHYWKNIIDAILDMLISFEEHEIRVQTSQGQIEYFVFTRSANRISEFLNKVSLEMNTVISLNGQQIGSLQSIVDHLFQILSEKKDYKFSLWHGDLCFSNIFYDQNKRLPIIIDPRGSMNDIEFSNVGPNIYDIAKLNHSITGLYDQILSDRFFINYSEDLSRIDFKLPEISKNIQVQKYFLMQVEKRFGHDQRQITCWTCLLFLTLLPLHSEDKKRQVALFANGLRMYKNLKEMK